MRERTRSVTANNKSPLQQLLSSTSLTEILGGDDTSGLLVHWPDRSLHLCSADITSSLHLWRSEVLPRLQATRTGGSDAASCTRKSIRTRSRLLLYFRSLNPHASLDSASKWNLVLALTVCGLHSTIVSWGLSWSKETSLFVATPDISQSFSVTFYVAHKISDSEDLDNI